MARSHRNNTAHGKPKTTCIHVKAPNENATKSNTHTHISDFTRVYLGTLLVSFVWLVIIPGFAVKLRSNYVGSNYAFGRIWLH